MFRLTTCPLPARRPPAPALLVTTILLALLGGGFSALAAQGGGDSPRPSRAQIMRQIEQRFMARATEELGLDAEQAERLRSTATHFAVERRKLEQAERETKRALGGQLRPGVAADQDSLVVLLDRLSQTRRAYLDTFDDELAEMADYLDPVQRAQYVMLRERLTEQIRRIRYTRRDPRQDRQAPREDF